MNGPERSLDDGDVLAIVRTGVFFGFKVVVDLSFHEPFAALAAHFVFLDDFDDLLALVDIVVLECRWFVRVLIDIFVLIRVPEAILQTCV